MPVKRSRRYLGSSYFNLAFCDGGDVLLVYVLQKWQYLWRLAVDFSVMATAHSVSTATVAQERHWCHIYRHTGHCFLSCLSCKAAMRTNGAVAYCEIHWKTTCPAVIRLSCLIAVCGTDPMINSRHLQFLIWCTGTGAELVSRLDGLLSPFASFSLRFSLLLLPFIRFSIIFSWLSPFSFPCPPFTSPSFSSFPLNPKRPQPKRPQVRPKGPQ